MKLKNSLFSLFTITLFLLLPAFQSSGFAQTPHPILRVFTGQVINDQMRLNWIITSGNTCSGIRIQRSADGQFFETVGEIDGICGSPDVDIPYVFIDEQPIANQVNYYRLELGSQGYSSPIAIEYIPLNNQGFSLRYDILSKTATVYFNNSVNKIAVYELITLSGQTILENSTTESSIHIALSDFSAQIFLLRINIGGLVIPVKIPAF